MFNSRRPSIKLPVYRNYSKRPRQKLILKLVVILFFILIIIARWNRLKHKGTPITNDPIPHQNRHHQLEVQLPIPASSDAKNFKELTIARETKLAPVGESIPKIVHFIYGLRDPNPQLDLIHYLAIKSAHDIIKPEKIMFHYHYMPTGNNFERARHMLTLNKVDLVEQVFDRPVSHYAHRADVVRLQVLEQYGGIYLDLDVISLKPIDKLLDREFVMAQEGIDGSVGLCNAMIMSRPHSRFIQRWYSTYTSFDSSDWNYHSVVLPGKLAPFFSKEITVLNYTAFFWPLWDSDGLRTLYLEKSYDFSSNLGIHVWESAANKNLMKDINDNVIMEIDTSLYCVVRPFLLDGKPDPRPDSCRIQPHSSRLDQLVGHWTLQEPKHMKPVNPAPAHDDSGNHLTGIIRNGKYTSGGVYLPGDASYIFLNMPTETSATSFTVSWWMKTTSKNNGEMAMVIQTSHGRIRVKTSIGADNELSLAFDTVARNDRWEWADVEGTDLRPSPYIIDEEYHHYSLVIEKKELALQKSEPPIVFYMDGRVASSNINWIYPEKIGNIVRGVWFGSIEPLNDRYQNPWDSTVDLEAQYSDIRVWERGLSVNEVFELYNSGILKSTKTKDTSKPKKTDATVNENVILDDVEEEGIENEDEDEELLWGADDQSDD